MLMFTKLSEGNKRDEKQQIFDKSPKMDEDVLVKVENEFRRIKINVLWAFDGRKQIAERLGMELGGLRD